MNRVGALLGKLWQDKTTRWMAIAFGALFIVCRVGPHFAPSLADGFHELKQALIEAVLVLSLWVNANPPFSQTPKQEPPAQAVGSSK